MKKFKTREREQIIVLLERYSARVDYPKTVTIIGSKTDAELYSGTIWEVPFRLCADYVISYTFDAESRHLKICSDYHRYF